MYEDDIKKLEILISELQELRKKLIFNLLLEKMKKI